VITVITGTEKFSFHRMIEEIDAIARKTELAEEFFLQIGASKYEPSSCEWVRFVQFREMVKRIQDSEVVISHAGAGSTLLCLQQGKRPIVMPRQKKFDEHVDDHQVLFAQKLADRGLVRLVLDEVELNEAVREELENPARVAERAASGEVVAFLEGVMSDIERQRRPGAA
jgi:UDP-N-acetylglucosamine transferase subunit ALG13